MTARDTGAPRLARTPHAGAGGGERRGRTRLAVEAPVAAAVAAHDAPPLVLCAAAVLLVAHAHTGAPAQALRVAVDPGPAGWDLALALRPEQTLGEVVAAVRRASAAAASPSPGERPELAVSLGTDDRAPAAPGAVVHARFVDGDGLACVLDVDRAVLHDAAARRMAGHLVRALALVAAQPRLAVADALVLTPAERDRLVGAWNATDAPVPAQPVHELVRRQVDRDPAAVAVRDGATVVGYGQLWARAGALARRLRHAGAGPGTIVGGALPRGADLPIAFLAVLRTGAAYLPLDLTHPPQRTGFVLDDAGCGLVVARAPGWSATPPASVRTVLLDDAAGAAGDGDPLPPVPASAPAYAIYTSGSTGRPKGVAIAHRSLVNLLLDFQRTPGMTARDVALALASPAFDLSVLELLLPLVSGAQLVVAAGPDAADGAALARLIADAGVTYVHATPATWRLLLRGGLPRLRTAVSGGETLDAALATALLARADRVFNSYGPTETTVGSTVLRVTDPQAIGIGRPIANTTTDVLDRLDRLAPIGVPGALVIGGVGVADGYLRRPQLTRERFVEDPLRPGRRVYRTGDVVRRRDDGVLEFLGRDDDQLKLRGYRIEPGEIEAVLREQPGVGDALVVARRDDAAAARLVAYVQEEGRGRAPAAAALRAGLERRLPAYMVPSAFVVVDAFPLTPSGKVDRAALPAPGRPAPAPADPGEPLSALEARLAAIWAAALGVGSVGRDEDFFALGGHSLLAAEVVSRAREELDLDVSLRALFSHPTVGALVDAVRQGDGAAGDEPGPIPRRTREADGG